MKSALVIGLGRFGINIVKKLDETGHEVMAADVHEEKVDEALTVIGNARIGDCSNRQFLESLDIPEYHSCFVTVKDFKDSLEIVSQLKDLGAKYVVARAKDEIHEKFLLRNGADAVVFPEKQLAAWTAICYMSSHIFDYIKLDEKNSIFEIVVPEKWENKSIAELNVRRKHNITILGTKSGDSVDVSINGDTVFAPGEHILVVGNMRDIEKCLHIYGK